MPQEESIQVAKKLLRNEIKKRVTVLSSPELLRESSSTLQMLTHSYSLFLEAKTVLFYWSMKGELDTHETVNRCFLSTSKRVLLPVVVKDELVLKEYGGRESLKPVPPFGIEEPVGTEMVDPSEVDLVIVPGMAFDKRGGRMGRGKGFYDRLFARMPKAHRVGVCLTVQLVDEVPMEPHDYRMHALVCGRELIRCECA